MDTESTQMTTDQSGDLRQRIRQFFQNAIPRDNVARTVDTYREFFKHDQAVDPRTQNAADAVRMYYDLATDFYEFGWGQSFHFAPLRVGEPVEDAIRRHEHYLAMRLGLKPGQRVLDAGCGVGGPMRSIARISGANIVGVNISKYQIGRGERHVRREALQNLCTFVETDFTKMPFQDGDFDAAYAMEATCHCADRRDVFRDVFRVLKPGALFAGFEWCTTDKYDANNPEHVEICRGIEEGNGLPPAVPTKEIDRSLTDVGFELLEGEDHTFRSDPATPWYMPLDVSMTPKGFLHSRAGAALTHGIVSALEASGLSPKGTVDAHSLLRLAQRTLVQGGKLGIFTPMYFFLARKPAR